MTKLILLLALVSPTACAQQNAAGEALIKTAVESKDDDARWQAIRKIGELKYKPAIPLLLKSLSDPHHYVRANAARALSDMNVREAQQPLVELLSHETDGGVIQQTTLGIRKFGAKEALPALRRLANHEDQQTRIWVLQTIGQFGSKEDVTCVASYMDSPEIMMQSFAAEMLGGMANQDFGVVKQGLSGMHHIGAARDWWSQHKQDYPDCTWGLPKEQQELGTFIKDLRTADKTRNPERVKKLLELANHKEREIRFAAIDALRRLQDPESIPTLVKLMDDPNWHIQYQGMMTLCEMNSPGGKGSGCPSTILFRKAPEQYKTQWKEWWRKQQAK